jgi:hypothetical protein
MNKKLHFNVICVGAGGSGGNFAKEFARYMASLSNPDITASFALIDGDKVEESNRTRQPFSEEDVAQNKATSLIDAIKDVFNLRDVYSYPDYVDTKEDINVICELHKKHARDGFYLPNSRDIIILVGCVDNHRARQAMNDFFYTKPDIVYIDSANEFSVGEICIGARFNGQTEAPPRAHYYPDVLTDKSPSASEISCGAMNVSSPQHIATNLMAAHLVLALVANIISNGKIDYGIIYFDSFKYFSRFDRFEGPVPRKKVTGKGAKANEKSVTKRN